MTATTPSTGAPSPTTLAPRSKIPTSSSGADSDTAPAASRRRAQQTSLDPLSDRATSNLIRRALCPQQRNDKDREPPVEELLPPLTSRNDVDLQLYAFIAILLRDFVQSWYGKITTDEAFVAEVVHVVAHCTRGLEQKFRKVDLESLVLDEIPDLLNRHITAYRTAHHPITGTPLKVDPRQVYHSLCPLPPLSPVPHSEDVESVEEQKANEAAYRQLLVQAVLAVLLPTEDLENPCLTSLVGQIFSELIIGNVVINKAAQPWMLWEGICILARVLREKKAKTVEKLVSGSPDAEDVKPARRWTARGFFLSIINFVLLFVTSLRLLFGAIASSTSLPPRISIYEVTGGSNHSSTKPHDDGGSSPKVPVKHAFLSYRAWSCAGNLIQLPSRMPWLHGFLSLVQHGAINGLGRVGGLDGPVDRFFSKHIQSLFSPHHLPPLLRTLRGLLFPNNGPGKPSLFPPASEAELHALRRRAASALWGLLPTSVGRLYLGGRLPPHSKQEEGEGDEDEDMIDEVDQILAVLDDEYCNKHLLYGVLELILVRLMPELSEKGVEELWEERLG